MAKSIDDDLSRRERQIMQIIFARGDATVTDIVEDLPDAVSETAVRTFLQNLQKKGHVKRRKNGRKHVYRPTGSRARAARQALNNVLGVFFDHSVSDALAAHLTDPSTDLSQDELDRLQNLIEKARREEKES